MASRLNKRVETPPVFFKPADPNLFFAKYPDVKFVRFQFVDYAGVLHTHVVSKELCLEFFEDNHRLYKLEQQNCLVAPISTSPRHEPEDITPWYLCPSFDNPLMVCGFSPSHASQMCRATYAPKDSLHMHFYERCPRQLLVFASDQLVFSHRLKLLVGFEWQFFLRGETSHANNKIIMEDILAALDRSGIEIDHFDMQTTEQFQIALSHEEAERAVESFMMARETIQTICSRHGLEATAFPRPTANGPQNNCRLHISMHPDKPMPEMYASFLNGLLRGARSICAVGLANYDSYGRAATSVGDWIGWGTNNDEMPVCQHEPYHLSVRFFDTTANAYLFASAVIHAGWAGINTKAALTFSDCQLKPSSLSTADVKGQLAQFGITERLPKSLEEAIECLRKDDVARSWINEELSAQYIKTKEIEIKHFSTMDPEERRKKFLRYF